VFERSHNKVGILFVLVIGGLRKEETRRPHCFGAGSEWKEHDTRMPVVNLQTLKSMF